MPFYDSFDTIRKKAPTVKIYARATWAEDWTEYSDDGLWCKSLEYASNAGKNEAVLEYQYGSISPAPGSDFRTTRETLPLGPKYGEPGHYIKIQISGDGIGTIPAWYGRVIDEIDECRGSSSAAAETGTQTFVCWGLAEELDNDPILHSRITDRGGAETIVPRVIAFNCGPGWPRDKGDRSAANKSQKKGFGGSYAFAQDLATADEWTGLDIAEYLLTEFAGHGPDPAFPMPAIPWKINPLAPTDHLATYRPRLHCEGKTVKKVLDELMDRRRGMGWHVGVDENTNPHTCYVLPWTQFSAQINLPDGTVIPANSSQRDIDVSDAIDCTKCSLRWTAATSYDQVVVRGGPLGVVFTISTKTSTLEADWTSADEILYNAAESSEAGYSALTRCQKEEWNDAFRSSHTGVLGERVRRVYSWFRLATAWTGYAENCPDAQVVLAQTEEELPEQLWKQIDWGKLTPPWWRPGLRFEAELPLYETGDYSAFKVKDAATGYDPASPALKPIVLIKVETGTGGAADRYQYVDKLNSAADDETADEGGRGWAAKVETQRDVAGLVLTVSGKAAQHKLAKNHFTGQPVADCEEIPVDLDYADDLRATVYMLTDEVLEARYPPQAQLEKDLPAGAVPRRRIIEMPDTRLDYIMPNTIVGLAHGEPILCESGGVLQSDLARMTSIAELAAQWYCTPRITLDLEFKQIYGVALIGDLVTKITVADGDETVDTVVTRVRYDLDGGRTIVQTAFCELDLKAM